MLILSQISLHFKENKIGCTISLLHMNRLSKTESAVFVSLIPEDLYSELILSSLQLVLFRVAAVKRLAYITLVQIIYFLVLWDHWAHSVSV